VSLVHYDVLLEHVSKISLNSDFFYAFVGNVMNFILIKKEMYECYVLIKGNECDDLLLLN